MSVSAMVALVALLHLPQYPAAVNTDYTQIILVHWLKLLGS